MYLLHSGLFFLNLNTAKNNSCLQKMKPFHFMFWYKQLFFLTITVSIFFTTQAQQLFSSLRPAQTGISFQNKLIETPADNIITYEYFYNGGGVALADFNNDGSIDIYFTSNQQPNALYYNKGNWQFEDVTKKAGVTGKKGWKTGVSVADVNGDGWVDIYVCYSGDLSEAARQNQLFINNRNGSFTDKAKEMGVADAGYSTQAAFFDYDNDGDLDLFVINHNIKVLRNFDAAFVKKMVDAGAGDRLYRNDKNRFTDVTVMAGIISNPIGYGLGLNISDINKDGWPDIYVSNDYVEEDYLYINNKDGSFKECLKNQLGHLSNFSMGVDIADINNDSYADIFTLDMLPEDNKRQKLLYTPDNYELYKNTLQNGFYHQLMRNMLQLNNGNQTFSEIGQLAGVSNTDWSWAALLADFTNDGLKDIFITNGYGRDMINMDFMKFYANERMKYTRGEPSARMFQMLSGIKSTPLHNYLYENNGNLTFANRSYDCGFDELNFSHGAAYADLDNDGDLDLVVNHMNQTAGIYKNNCTALKKENHFIKINLRMPGGNTFALGAKLSVFTKNGVLYIENYPVHGFQSAMLAPLHTGLNTSKIDSIQIIWPDGGVQTITENIPADTTLTFQYKKFTKPAITSSIENTVFAASYQTIPFTHTEDDVNDFKIQPLMPNMLSYAGPHVSGCDVNKDGLTDFYIGGAANTSGAILIQQTNGSFLKLSGADFDKDAAAEDTDAVFFDADGDGDEDLYVVSGGYVLPENDASYQDRLYINNNGTFTKNTAALPNETVSGSMVTVLDFDKDGDNDLFVGARVVPGKYPQTPASLLLQNDGKGNFKNVTAAMAPALQFAGMITDAAFIDINKDGTNELVICGEWMPIKVFEWINGQFTESTDKYFAAVKNGWWNRLCIADLDKDGDMDIVAANWGNNSQLHASEKEPMTMYYADFDNNGYIDPLLCYFINDKSYPMASRDEITDQIVSLRQRFPTYDSYSEATIENILTAEQMAIANKLTVEELSTCWFENKNGKMIPHMLPVEAGNTPVYAIMTDDFNNDGNIDILLGGNVDQVRIRIGRMDASFGVLLAGDGKGGFKYVPQLQSGLNIKGCVKDFLKINSTGKTKKLIAGINNQTPVLLNY